LCSVSTVPMHPQPRPFVRQLSLDFCENWPIMLCEHTIHQVIWTIPSQLVYLSGAYVPLVHRKKIYFMSQPCRYTVAPPFIWQHYLVNRAAQKMRGHFYKNREIVLYEWWGYGSTWTVDSWCKLPQS